MAAVVVAMTAVMTMAVVMMALMTPAMRMRVAMARSVVDRLAVIHRGRITVVHRRRLRIVDAAAMVPVIDDDGTADDGLGLRHACAKQSA